MKSQVIWLHGQLENCGQSMSICICICVFKNWSTRSWRQYQTKRRFFIKTKLTSLIRILLECFLVKYLRLRPGSPHWTLLGMLRECREDDNLFRNDAIVIRFHPHASTYMLLLSFFDTTNTNRISSCRFWGIRKDGFDSTVFSLCCHPTSFQVSWYSRKIGAIGSTQRLDFLPLQIPNPNCITFYCLLPWQW